jgi:hypothetical protein
VGAQVSQQEPQHVLDAVEAVVCHACWKFFRCNMFRTASNYVFKSCQGYGAPASHARSAFKRWPGYVSLFSSYPTGSKYVLGACGGHGAPAVHARSGLGGVQRLQRPEGEGLRASLGSAGYACLADRGMPLDFSSYRNTFMPL